MKALIFDYKPSRLAVSYLLGKFYLKGYLAKYGAFNLKEIEAPVLKLKNWALIKTQFCGICGSDHKQVFLDGNRDNPMTALISWPQVLGHEAVGMVKKVNEIKDLNVGDRVVLNPWISCEPRGIKPICNSCERGKKSLCKNFTKGKLTRGIHTGNSSDVTGGFAEYFPAHQTMAIKIPDYISSEQAMLSDPFSVAFHSTLKVKIFPGAACVVYGCGNLGLLTILILSKIYEDLTIIAIARYSHQAKMALKFGADFVIKSSPSNEIIEKIADYLNHDIYYLKRKKPWLLEGVDFLFDTVATPESLETGLRIVKSRISKYKNSNEASGFIIVTGVSSPKRFEWTPWYFKEINMIGSNAFAIEEYNGLKQHAYHYYFEFLNSGLFDPIDMITHKFPLDQYKKAFITARNQKKYRSIKVAFDFDN